MVDLAGADFDDRDVGSSANNSTNNSTNNSANNSTNSLANNSSNLTTAQQRKESIDINKSLLALKECFR